MFLFRNVFFVIFAQIRFHTLSYTSKSKKFSKMAKHISLGKKGEQLAIAHLKQKSYQILETNWRYKKAEVDIIALFENVVIFVEVKTRRTNFFGYPEESVSDAKKRLLSIAAEAYMYEKKWDTDMRFDIIAITLNKQTKDIYHIEDAFFGY